MFLDQQFPISTRTVRFVACCLLFGMPLASSAPAAELTLQSIEIESPDDHRELLLSDPDMDWQVLVTGRTEDGRFVDVTDRTTFIVEPQKILNASRSGLITPRADGTATVVARVGKLEARIKIAVQNFGVQKKLDFLTDVAPVFTRYGCNSGGCHGKKGGQEGFELALLGFEPEADYDRLVKDGDGYRIDLDKPDESYLLRKATKAEPHAGGQRFKRDSAPYRLLRRWIAQGAPRRGDNKAVVERIEVLPSHRILQRREQQRLSVIAILSDGSIREVGRLSQFTPNQPSLVSVSQDGVAVAGDVAGVGSIMVRYQAHVAVFQASVPTGDSIKEFPASLNLVDDFVFEQLRRLGIPASIACDDATFIRRATIDIAGRIPTVDETAAFTTSNDPKKFADLIDRLIKSDDCADYFAGKWAALLRNRRNSLKDPREPTAAFYQWIRETLRDNRPYDEFVRDVLTATGQEVATPPVVWYRTANEPSAQIEDVAQLFLGQRIQCARCHHHPFEQWSQQDYYGLTAFFSRLKVESPPKTKKQKQKPPLSVTFKPGRAAAKHPTTGKPIPPTPLGASPINIGEQNDPRVALVDWMTHPDNRFFARVLVNRYWKHFMGRGLVEPEDDLRVTNPPTNPQLLDALARHFVESKCNLRELIRLICLSRTYRASSLATGSNANDRQNFSRFLPRRLSAEVLLDAIDVVTLSKTQFAGVGADVRAVQLPDNQSGSYFLSAFGRPAGLSVCECERSSDATLAQQLHLINSPEIQTKIRGARAKGLSNDQRSPKERFEQLFMVALSRKPRPAELAALQRYLDQRVAGKASEKLAAFADIIWALINTKEFQFNH